MKNLELLNFKAAGERAEEAEMQVAGGAAEMAGSRLGRPCLLKAKVVKSCVLRGRDGEAELCT